MAGKRRIFCIITQGELGGAQRFVAQLAQNLDQERFRLHVVWGSESDSSLGRLLPDTVTFSTVRHLVRRVSPWHDLMAVRELRALMRPFRPDVVLTISSKAGFVGSLAAHGLRSSIPGLKVVYRIGGWTFNDPWPAWKRKLYQLLEKFSARWKDYIVLNNTHDLDQAHMLGIRPRVKVVRIYNGIDPYAPLVNREQARAYLKGRIPDRFRHAPYDVLVGTIANFYPTKDLATFVRAAARIGGNVRFIVIGDGPQRQLLERMITEYELEDHFFLLGRLAEASRYIQAFDVFVLSSVKEGFPWGLLEAMAAKVPAVATRVGAVPEMLEDHKSGIVMEPGQPDRLASAIVEVLGSDRLKQELAISAHQQVITKFSLREMIAQYERLFTL